MLTGNVYPITGESLFSEEENHEIYKEIYGDPIYDIYEDDDVLVIDHVDFVFSDGAFEKICAEFVQAEICAGLKNDQICAQFVHKHRCAKFVHNHSCAKIGCDKINAKIVQKVIGANFGYDLFHEDFWKKRFRANFGSDPARAKIGQNQEMKIKMDLRRYKIRGRIFLGRRDLMQRDIWKYSKYLLLLSFN